MKKYMEIIKISLLPAVVLMLGACSGRAPEESRDAVQNTENILTLTEEQIGLAGISSGQPEEMLLADVLSCNGYVRVPPRGQVTVSLPLECYVREIHFHWGEKIRKGDLLAVVEHPDFLKLQQEYII